MFGLSFGELLIIAVIALLLLGPDRLPEAAKTVGKGLRELRKATEDLKDQVESEIYSEDRKKVKPALVPPIHAQPVPGPAGPPPAATAENVPGLELAIGDPDEAPAPPAAPSHVASPAEAAAASAAPPPAPPVPERMP
jgi:sec-independent protein translocase protein TatB